MTATPTRQEDPLPADRVREILDRITRVRVAVCGDFCLDAYWMLNPRGGEVSAETGLPAQAVGRHYYSLGGAANVVANLAALRPAQHPGDRHRRRRHLRPRAAAAASRTRRRYGGDGRPARALRHGHVRQALRRRRRSAAHRLRVLQRAQPGDRRGSAGAPAPGDRAVRRRDLQPAGPRRPERGVHRRPRTPSPTPTRRRSSCATRATTGAGSGTFTARRTTPRPRGSTGSRSSRRFIRRSPRLEVVRHPPLRGVGQAGVRHPGRARHPDGGRHAASTWSPASSCSAKTDTVGAGDTVTSALALCLGAGLSPAEAAGFANFAAAVTVQKLFQTGTASPEEVLAVSDAPRLHLPAGTRRRHQAGGRTSTGPRSRPAAGPCRASPTSATPCSTTTARSARCGRAGNGSWSR